MCTHPKTTDFLSHRSRAGTIVRVLIAGFAKTKAQSKAPNCYSVEFPTPAQGSGCEMVEFTRLSAF